MSTPPPPKCNCHTSHPLKSNLSFPRKTRFQSSLTFKLPRVSHGILAFIQDQVFRGELVPLPSCFSPSKTATGRRLQPRIQTSPRSSCRCPPRLQRSCLKSRRWHPATVITMISRLRGICDFHGNLDEAELTKALAQLDIEGKHFHGRVLQSYLAGV